jgi:prepilin-type N-terminal cleavage/methylation domain-containing protein
MKQSAIRAFTLTELLVVIAIIGLLSSLIFSVFASSKSSAKAVSCISNLSQHFKSLSMYSSDNSDRIVPMWDSEQYSFDFRTISATALSSGGYPLVIDALSPYGLSDMLRECPEDKKTFSITAILRSSGQKEDILLSGGAYRSQKTSYGFNPLLGFSSQWQDPCSISSEDTNVRPFVFRDAKPDIHSETQGRSNLVFSDGSAKSKTPKDVILAMGCVPQ